MKRIFDGFWKYLYSYRTQLSKFNQLYRASNGKANYGSYRYFFMWRKSLQPGRTPLNDEKAWVVFSALKFLNFILNDNMRVFEYGSGGSSIFFSRRVKEVFSVEHDRLWLEKTAAVIKAKGITNWKGYHCEAEEDSTYSTKDLLVTEHYISSWESFKGKNFFHYASFIDRFENDFFDLVMIDGRVRPSCFFHAKDKVKKGGYLVLDNSERDRYDVIHKKLIEEKWTKFNFFGPGPYANYEFWQTTIWQRK